MCGVVVFRCWLCCGCVFRFRCVCVVLFVWIVSVSPVHGYGLFARRDYCAKELIVAYEGEMIDAVEKERRYPKHDLSRRARYAVECGNGMFIDARNKRKSSPARYINTAGKHSRFKNNATITVFYRNNVPHANVRATRYIYMGEEFFMPYGSGYVFV